mmetsp:Transcript_14692/g.33565  ORF Transcript_14692/g.33565 Transcript_14692/m.33565 type:complete len:107 (-) Transcript_14692:333-653(-)
MVAWNVACIVMNQQRAHVDMVLGTAVSHNWHVLRPRRRGVHTNWFQLGAGLAFAAGCLDSSAAQDESTHISQTNSERCSSSSTSTLHPHRFDRGSGGASTHSESSS